MSTWELVLRIAPAAAVLSVISSVLVAFASMRSSQISRDEEQGGVFQPKAKR